MPTVLRVNGFQVRIYTDDHFPPHVHVFYGDGEIVIYLNGQYGREPNILWVRESHDLKAREQRNALAIVAQHYDTLRQAWEAIHGKA